MELPLTDDDEQRFLRDDARKFLDYLNKLPGPTSREAGLEGARAMLVKSRHVADLPTGDIAVLRDLSCPGPRGEIALRLYDARESRDEPGPLLLFFHGGGYVLGDLETHEPFCAEIARLLDMPVLAVDYRLAPEHPFPAGVEDCIAAARWAAGSPGVLGRQVDGLVLAGDSAGGNFTIVTAMALRDEPAAVPVLAQWPIYPAADPGRRHASFDLYSEGYLLSRDSMAWFDECYAPDRKDWRNAPLLRSQAGMPPTLVLTAGADPIRDQGRAYAAACVHAGVTTVFREARGNIHGFINLRKAIPSSEDDIVGAVQGLKMLIEEARAGR
ncbi:MAG TPA: alpha/beta hydrolase [Allosphingosinicella sp.]|nr:alpha/beta hydrolase [Allosphingosinicella sp.]